MVGHIEQTSVLNSHHQILKCHAPKSSWVLNATERYSQMNLNGVFSFSLSCLVFEIFRGSLHEDGLSYNQDRSHSVSVETIGDRLDYICLHE